MNDTGLRNALRIVVLAMIFVTPALGQAAQFDQDGRWVNGVSEPWWFDSSLSRTDIQTMLARWTAIGQELSNFHDGFAGEYFEGDETHGTYFRWAPKSGFVSLNVDKCAAQVMGFRHGKTVPSRPFLTLVPELSALRSSSHGRHQSQPLRLALVTWRSIPYLMEDKQIAAFCDYVAGLGKFNAGLLGNWDTSFLTGRGTASGSADEFPVVPAGYERLIKKAINASIIAVGKRVVRKFYAPYDKEARYESRTQVTVDSGRTKGVTRGMKFIVLIRDEDDEVVITAVGNDRSAGVIVRYVDENPKKPFSLWKDYDRYEPIKPGWMLSTSVHKLLDQMN